MLTWKAFRADGHLGRWFREDVDDLLLTELPARLRTSSVQAASVPASLAALFAFLTEEDLLAPESEPAADLARRAQAQARSFLDAMDEPERLGMAKRLSEAMGLTDLDDISQADIDAAMERFNALSFEERGAILGLGSGGPGTGAHPPFDDGEDLDPVPLPYRDLPDDDELDRLAADVPLLARIDRLAAELPPEGVKLTKAGWLPLADGRRLVAALELDDPVDLVRTTADLPGLFATVQIGLDVGAIAIRDGRMVPEPAWPDRPAGERWADVAQSLLAEGVTTMSFGAREPHPLTLADQADSAAIVFLAVLWSADEPVPESLLGETLTAAFDEGVVDHPLVLRHPDVARLAIPDRATEALRALVDAGVVDHRDRTVELRRGGDLVAVPILDAAGFVATTPDDVAELDAESLLDLLVEHDLTLGIDLGAAWLAAGEGRADELVAAVSAAPDPTRIVSALSLLENAGEVGLDALRGAIDTPMGPNVRLLLVERGELDPTTVPPEVAVEAGIVTLLALVDAGSPADLVESVTTMVPADEETSFLDGLSLSRHPRTAEVFELVGRHHPDKATGKHARKLAHRWRSAHGSGR